METCILLYSIKMSYNISKHRATLGHLMYLIGRNMFTSDNIKLSEVMLIWLLALSSALYPALIEFVGFCFICSFCLSFLLPGMIGLSDLKTILTLSSTSYGCAVYRSVGQWQKFIHYKHVSDYHKFAWCLPWAFPLGFSWGLFPVFNYY